MQKYINNSRALSTKLHIVKCIKYFVVWNKTKYVFVNCWWGCICIVVYRCCVLWYILVLFCEWLFIYEHVLGYCLLGICIDSHCLEYLPCCIVNTQMSCPGHYWGIILMKGRTVALVTAAATAAATTRAAFSKTVFFF